METILNASKHKSPVVHNFNYKDWPWKLVFVSPTADIDDMKICYVLLDGSNATSDIFYFTIEDKGRYCFN